MSKSTNVFFPQRVLLGACAALALLALAAPAGALTQKQLEQCSAGPDLATVSPDIAIQACTAAIRSGRFSGKQLAVAFFVRGHAHVLKREEDRALADFNEAIRLDPDDPDAFYQRGYIYDDKHDYDRAIADFNEAIRLGPNIPILLPVAVALIAIKRTTTAASLI